MAYFLMGAIMWAGGAVAYDDVGVASLVVNVDESSSSATVNESTGGEFEGIGGPIQEAASTVGLGGLIAVLDLFLKLLGFLFWPITVLVVNDAPLEVIVLLGGTPTFALVVAAIRSIRRS